MWPLPLITEAFVGTVQNRERRRKWQAARSAADQVRKPLLVVGMPIGSKTWRLTGRAFVAGHGEGDITLDLDPEVLVQCPDTGVVGDVRAIPFPDRYFGASLASHILEHMGSIEDCLRALEELSRVTDGPIYIAYPRRWSVIANLIPDHYLWVEQVDGVVRIQDRSSGRREVWRRSWATVQR